MGTELAVPALAQTQHFSCPHYSDTLTKSNKAKNKEERAKSVSGKSSLQTSRHKEGEMKIFYNVLRASDAGVFRLLN